MIECVAKTIDKLKLVRQRLDEHITFLSDMFGGADQPMPEASLELEPAGEPEAEAEAESPAPRSGRKPGRKPAAPAAAKPRCGRAAKQFFSVDGKGRYTAIEAGEKIGCTSSGVQHAAKGSGVCKGHAVALLNDAEPAVAAPAVAAAPAVLPWQTQPSAPERQSKCEKCGWIPPVGKTLAICDRCGGREFVPRVPRA